MNRNPASASPRLSALNIVTHDAVAVAFAQHHAGTLRRVESWNLWLRWDGTRWAADRTGQTSDLVRDFCRAVSSDIPERQRLTGSAQFIRSVESLARTDRALAAAPEDFDKDAFLLNTPAGPFDLSANQLLSPDPRLLLSKCTNVRVGGPCPRWEAFVSRITSGDEDLAAFLQRIAGYCLTGSTREHALFFFHGSGANGKSTFINTLAHVMGDYAAVAAMDTFTATAGNRHPTDLAALRAARLVVAPETAHGSHWDEARIKAATGGDAITARFMRGDFFTYSPAYKILIAGNHKPRFHAVDPALKRRIHLIPFASFIPPGERDIYLPDRLRAESEGILRWAVEGALEWQRQGLNPPTAVADATAEYFSTQDPLADWLIECCEIAPGYRATPSELFSSWQSWANRSGEHAGNRLSFGNRLESAGYPRIKSNGQRFHLGLRPSQNPF